MTAHLSDSDRQALRLAHDLREEMRAAIPQLTSAPSVSPFVDQTGTPSVLLRMDADTARALMAVMAERRTERSLMPPAEPRRADGSHVPPPVPPPAAQGVPGGQGPLVGASSPYGGPAYEATPFAPPAPGGPPLFLGGTGPTPLVPSAYPTTH